MKNLTVLCALTIGTLAFAHDQKGETQNCEHTRAEVLARKDLCADEAAALQTLDCANKQARARVDFRKLHDSCLKKKRAAPKDGGTEHEET